MPPLRTDDDETDHQQARPTRDSASGLPPTQSPAQYPTLTPQQRERITTELARQQIGDAIERRLFLAALDYQLTVLATRLLGRDADAGPASADTSALLAAACADAAGALDARTAAEAEQVCLGFVSELAGAFDACFETAPTPEPHGPFMRILALLREVFALPLALEADRLRPVITAPLAPAPRG